MDPTTEELRRVFELQRAAFARERYPTLATRRDRLARLFNIVTVHEKVLCAAIDRDFGHRTYAARVGYEWLQSVTPATATVQANTKVAFQDTLGMMYGERPYAAVQADCNATFGGDPKLCGPLVARVREAFPVTGQGPARLMPAAESRQPKK